MLTESSSVMRSSGSTAGADRPDDSPAAVGSGSGSHSPT